MAVKITSEKLVFGTIFLIDLVSETSLFLVSEDHTDIFSPDNLGPCKTFLSVSLKYVWYKSVAGAISRR